MTPVEWKKLLGDAKASTSKVKKTIAHEARSILSQLAPGMTMGTNELVETLYPRNEADKSRAGDEARNKLYRVVQQLAVETLKDCCIKSDISSGKYMGKPRYPWIWFCPPEQELCYACGQVVPKEEE